MTAAALIVIGFLLLSGAGAWSISPVAPAVVTMPDGITKLTSGGSATAFFVTVPANSHCSKDTSTGHYTFTTYIVPSTVDPATLTWSSGAPSMGFQLFDASGNAVGPLNTAITSGNIQNAANLNFALFTIAGSSSTNTLPAGAYNVGIACVTDTGATDVFWNVVLTFTASASDPNGEVWQVVPNSEPPTTPPPSSTTTTTIGSGGTTTLSSSTTGSTSSRSSSGTLTTSSGALVATGARARPLLALGIALVGAGLLVVAFSERQHDGPGS